MTIYKDIDIDIDACDFDNEDIQELVTDWIRYDERKFNLIKEIIETHIKKEDLDEINFEENKINFNINLDFLYYPNKEYAKEVFEKNRWSKDLIKFIKENY